MNIAIIPARGGSKRIPRKNIKNFLNKPIISYSIMATIKSNCFDKVVVSTDDLEIKQIAEKYGAEVPFLRSEENSSDTAGTVEVVLEVLGNLKEKYEYCCCIYPTAPFIRVDLLKEGYNTIKSSNVDSVFTVGKYSYPIQRALKINNNYLEMMQPENYEKRSQDLCATYHDAGQFYWLNIESFLKYKKIFMPKSIPITLSSLEMQDIDTEEDWKLAELKYKLLKGAKS